MKISCASLKKYFLTFICTFPLLLQADDNPGRDQGRRSLIPQKQIKDEKQNPQNMYGKNQEEYNRDEQNLKKNSDENFNNNCGRPYYYRESSKSCGDPCNSYWDNIRSPLIIGAAAIGGGFIGASIAGDGHNGHDGRDGTDGVDGAGFIADIGQSLTFTLTATIPTGSAVIVVPFVTTPNGVTLEGPPVTIIDTAPFVFAPILITNPVFGFYNFGLNFQNTSTDVLTGITLNGTLIVATRDGSSTSELTPIAGVTIPPNQSQISSTFTYDQANVP